MKYSLHSDTAILFFSRSAREESSCKRFVSGKRRNAHIAQSLIGHTRKQLRQTDLPVYEINEGQQQGGSFGERLANAFSEIFNKGYRYVIAVGNDTPELRSSHITEAKYILTEGKAQIVLGPSSDGGTWLMGYSRKAFDQHSFRQLPWNSPNLLQAVVKRAGGEGAISLLESFADIDSHNDLIHFLRQPTNRSKTLQKLVRFIFSILGSHAVKTKHNIVDLPHRRTQRPCCARLPCSSD